ncbi:MAG: hypothetical protein ACR2IK_19590, partial [Chloroflexota bacterium]
ATLVGAQLSGLGSTGALGLNQVALISLGVLVLVLGGGMLLLGGRFRPSATAPGSSRWADFEQERLELVVRLAALDERFTAGEISQAEYAIERDRGKQRLRELTLAHRDASPSGV